MWTISLPLAPAAELDPQVEPPPLAAGSVAPPPGVRGAPAPRKPDSTAPDITPSAEVATPSPPAPAEFPAGCRAARPAGRAAPARGGFSRRRPGRRRRPCTAKAVFDGPRHHLVGVVGDAVRAGAVVVAGGLPIGGVGVAREPEDRAQHPGGGEDRVGGIEGVSAAAVRIDVVALPDRRPRSWTTGAFADDRDLHRAAAARGVDVGAGAVAALLVADRGEEGPIDIEALPGLLVDTEPLGRNLAHRRFGRRGGDGRPAASHASDFGAEDRHHRAGDRDDQGREDADRDQGEKRSSATPGAHRPPPFRHLRLRRGGAPSRLGSGRFSAGGFLAESRLRSRSARSSAPRLSSLWAEDPALRAGGCPAVGCLPSRRVGRCSFSERGSRRRGSTAPWSPVERLRLSAPLVVSPLAEGPPAAADSPADADAGEAEAAPLPASLVEAAGRGRWDGRGASRGGASSPIGLLWLVPDRGAPRPSESPAPPPPTPPLTRSRRPLTH